MGPVPERRAVVVSVARAARRLAAAHWGLLATCALFLLVGAFVLDDYGISTDEEHQRGIGQAALDSLAGDSAQALNWAPHARYYGAVFEVPLLLVERMLGLDDGRDVYLSRHWLTHLFFLAGGVFSYLLVLRMFGSRLLALVALALFLLHPRLYAHSFFNSKDIPFAAMFMITLYLTHRAFRRETLGAFLLCGVGVGVLVNLRLLGLVLFGAVLALRGVDLLLAGCGERRRRVLLMGGGFALAATLTYYASLPALWPDPVGRFGEWWSVAASHPNPARNLFRGEWLDAPDGPPFEYIPVWIGITTPPVVLLLAVIGAAGLCWRAGRRPRDLWGATTIRFNLMLALLIVGTIIAIFVGRSNIYDGWRQVYFLYAPLAVLAVVGLHWLLSSTDHRWMRAGGYSLAVAGVAVTLVSMARIHPLEDSYYNGLVDRTTPDYLVSRYETDYWFQSHWGLLEEILEDHPDQAILVSHDGFWIQGPLLPDSERGRVFLSDRILPSGFYSDQPVSDQKYASRIYNSDILTLRGRKLEQEGERETILRAALAGKPLAALAGEPLAQSTFDIYRNGDMLVYLGDGRWCRDWNIVFIHAYPVDSDNLPEESKQDGLDFAHHGFFFWKHGVGVDDVCIAIAPLPAWPIDNLNTGQDDRWGTLWHTRFSLDSVEVDPAVLAGEPLVSSAFDVYLDGDELVYVREGCTEQDAGAAFRLHVYPVDADDLPAADRRHGFEGRDFHLWQRGHGRLLDGRCVAVAGLPDYPIAHVHTGQYDEGGDRWDERFSLAPPGTDALALTGEPAVSAFFDIHRDGGGLVYVREGCGSDDASPAFFLHVVPVDAGDLPAWSRGHGFENRDFILWQRGGRWKERCTAAVPLPEYPIASVRTGQYDETGRLWEVEFALTGGE